MVVKLQKISEYEGDAVVVGGGGGMLISGCGGGGDGLGGVCVNGCGISYGSGLVVVVKVVVGWFRCWLWWWWLRWCLDGSGGGGFSVYVSLGC